MSEDLRTRIERGAKLLDERAPGWRERIDLDRLDMGGCFDCVLGQLFGGYSTGADALGLHLPTDSSLGFDVDAMEQYPRRRPTGVTSWRREAHNRLTAAWREFLTEAKEEA